jgi:hypothetical protein
MVLGLIAIAGVAAVAAHLIPLPPLKTAAESKLSETLGRPVTVSSARLSLIDGPSLILTGVTVQAGAGFGERAFLKAEKVRAGIDASQFLRGRRLVIDSLTLNSPEISLVRRADGTWNWTTLGGKSLQAPAESSDWRGPGLAPWNDPNAITPIIALAGMIVKRSAAAAACATIVSFLNSADSTGLRSLKRIRIENASVRVVDLGSSAPVESLYTPITLNASLERQSNEAGPGTRASGELVVHSRNDGSGSEQLIGSLPYDLVIHDASDAAELVVSGQIGPGPLETASLRVSQFSLSGDLRAVPGSPLTANGRLTGAEMFIHTLNLSERVSRAVRIDLGDRSPGTAVGNLEADFQIDQGTVKTGILRLRQIDGLGDASARNGSFRINSAMTVDYAATITLTPDATARVKASGPLLGFLTTLLETNKQLSVPVTITGELSRPDVRVDVTRIF